MLSTWQVDGRFCWLATSQRESKIYPVPPSSSHFFTEPTTFHRAQHSWTFLTPATLQRTLSVFFPHTTSILRFSLKCIPSTTHPSLWTLYSFLSRVFFSFLSLILGLHLAFKSRLKIQSSILTCDGFTALPPRIISSVFPRIFHSLTNPFKPRERNVLNSLTIYFIYLDGTINFTIVCIIIIWIVKGYLLFNRVLYFFTYPEGTV